MEWIQIAGTNGKGSTATYLSEILCRSSKCGLFTSPHINSPLERFKINGESISQSEYDSLLNKFKENDLNNDSLAGLFGIWTEAAIEWFVKNKTDIAILETGLGGRKDPTNIVNSILQVLTPIDFDHMDYLGDTIRKITNEKCGIIKPQSKVISHPQHPQALEIIKRMCERRNSELTILDKSNITIHKRDLTGTIFSFNQAGLRLDNIKIKSFVREQVTNACVAALSALELGVDRNDIIEGLKNVSMQGRIELIDNVILDAAHNPAAISLLANTIKELFPKRHITVVTAVMKDKDIPKISERIKSFSDFTICTRADKLRGLEAKEYAAFFDNAQVYGNPEHAFIYAKDIAEHKNGLIVVCGSFYLLPFIYSLLKV